MEAIPKLPLNKGVRVLKTHPAGLVALEKSTGIWSHPNSPQKNHRALLYADYDFESECYHWKDTKQDKLQQFHLIHRIDGPTSGLIMGATDAFLAETVKELFEKQAVTKHYFTVLKGRVSSEQKHWIDILQRKRGRHQDQLRVVTTDITHPPQRGQFKGQTAITLLKLLESVKRRDGMALSLVEMAIKTGRTHQIRVQSAARFTPVVGDATYGDFRFNRMIERHLHHRRLFLHAHSISLAFRHLGRNYQFEAQSPVPKEFKDLLQSWQYSH